METPTYQEKQTLPLRGLYVAVVVAALVFAGWQTHETPESPLILTIVALLAGLALWGFSTLHVIVTSVEIRFGFPLLRRRIPIHELTVGDVERIPLLAGMGVHYWGGRWVYNARFGRGVELLSGKRRYLVGSDTPERLQAALLQVRPRDRRHD